MISGAYHADLINYIFRYVGDNQYEVYSGYVLSKCYSNFPDLYFLFNNHWLMVKADEYVVDASEAQDGSQCLLLIVALDAPYNIFGTPIFQGYYSVFEQDADGSARLGFAPNNLSSKPKPYYGNMATQSFDFDKSGAQYNPEGSVSTNYLIIYLIEGIIAVILVIIFYYVALPGFEDAFNEELGQVAAVSLFYFICCGLFEIYVVEPLLIMALGASGTMNTGNTQ